MRLEEAVEETVPIINTGNYMLPTVDLLDKPKRVKTNNEVGVEDNINKLEQVLGEFGIVSKVLL